MIKIIVDGKDMIPRGMGLAPRKEPFYVDYMAAADIVTAPGLKVELIKPDGSKVELKQSNIKELWDKYSDQYDKTVDKTVTPKVELPPSLEQKEPKQEIKQEVKVENKVEKETKPADVKVEKESKPEEKKEDKTPELKPINKDK